jgi:hypothetical protein
MARARNIKPGYFFNHELAQVDPLGRILFIGLWCIADRKGRLKDRPARIKAETLPYDDCDIDDLLRQLEEYGFILRYEIDGNKYIQVINFTKHQNPHKNERDSEIPAPDKHYTSTMQTPYKHPASAELAGRDRVRQGNRAAQKPVNHALLDGSHTSTIQAPEHSNTNPADSLLLIPDSLVLKEEPKTPPAEHGDTTTEERENLNTMKSIKDYPFDYQKDLDLLRQLSVDFPDIDIRAQIKRFAVYKLDKPLSKKSNPRLQLRNWMEKAREFKNERSAKSGASERYSAGSDPAGKYRKFVKS